MKNPPAALIFLFSVLCSLSAGLNAHALPAVERLAPELDTLLPSEGQVETLAEGFDWSEGPVWYQNRVLFSDVPENTVFQWVPGDAKATVFLTPSGMLSPRPNVKEQGSNGLTLDSSGRLVLCQHGERRIARLEPDGTQTPLATRFDGKRFNSPNDLAYSKRGDLYFTDPPYGLDPAHRAQLQELPFSGIYCLRKTGEIELLDKSLSFPNGIAFSPEESRLYVAVSDPEAPRIVAYQIDEKGLLKNPQTFFDAAPLKKAGRKGSCDGLKVDTRGNLFATGPGGVLVLSPEGKHLGSILTGQATGNCCWGGNGSELYITADMFLLRIQTLTRGSHLPSSIPQP
jgi:gluconolactonase